ncbi:MAG: hypothetical protein BGP13_10810 [Sphingobacteriales bacterium 40-81]|nr:MAG: hypothetical protein BGP13_10810 [Sphingobacteriales bacterium 40-81]
MARYWFLAFTSAVLYLPARAQNITTEADRFIKLLNNAQKSKALLPFDTPERYKFHFIPLNDRKGISMNELNAAQKQQVFALLRASLSNAAVEKITAIMQLEILLKELEQRAADDHYRDPGKYFLTIFGTPSDSGVWGWRFEGHHISFNFSAHKNLLLSGTPSFLGSNPAIVQSGPQKNKEILKEETTAGFELLHSLSAPELKKAIINTTAPSDIITGASRKAMIEQAEGVRYTELGAKAQLLFLQLLEVYLDRYKKELSGRMLQDIKNAGLENLRFAWAGYRQRGIGKPCYYRIHGPTIIIEYDNTQNNANHIHTVIRDLKNDFGEDALLEHYKNGHHKKKP